MRRALCRPMALALASLLLLAAAGPAGAATKLNGYWEANLSGVRVNDEYPWNVWRPNQYYELKLLSGIGGEGEVWVKFGGRWDAWNSPVPQPSLFLQEGHLKYRLDRGDRGFESFLFARERRHWVGNHLLQLVNEDNVSDGNNGQGVRLDTWRGPWNATYVLSDFSSQDAHQTDAVARTDDVHILRLTRRLDDAGSYLGGTYLRKVYGPVRALHTKQYNEVGALDALWVAGWADLSLEYAESRVPAEGLADTGWNGAAWDHGTLGQGLEGFLPRDGALRAEIRSFTVGDHRVGHYTVSAGYWRVGRDYRNYQGNDASDRVGHFFATYYRLPQRAVVYNLDWGRERHCDAYVNSVDDADNPLVTDDPRQWLNQKIYVEFINGFKASLAHNRTDESFLGHDYDHHDWLFELVVENKLAWLKTQFKIKDWETDDEKRIFGLETTINLSPAWKWYNRYMVASDAVEARQMLFTQLQYRPHDNLELFASYGPEWYGDWGELTNDADFESGGTMRDEFKLLAKTWF
ncbi:MAG: hypothetical protein JW819_00410 [Candidatus Krumholzibacteriota bacterium]|nr:hypothetical protein [Candidatus Krumholzibacteriota bacterium]